MKLKVNPKEPTTITIVPSEDIGFMCALLLENEYIDATLRLTEDDVRALIKELEQYG